MRQTSGFTYSPNALYGAPAARAPAVYGGAPLADAARPLIHDWLDHLTNEQSVGAAAPAGAGLQSERNRAGDDDILSLTCVLNINTTAAQLAREPSRATVRSQANGRLPVGAKFIPLESTVIGIKNTGAADLMLDLHGSTPVNTACIVPEGYAQGDIFLPANTAWKQVEIPLFTTDPAKAANIERFNGWHRITPATLENSVLLTIPPQGARAGGAVVKCESPLFDMIRAAADGLGLIQGENFGMQQYGNAMVAMLPTAIVQEQIARGKEIIADLPFRNPCELMGEFVRADAAAFNDVSAYVGSEAGRDVSQDFALNSSFQAAVQIRHVYRIWRDGAD